MEYVLQLNPAAVMRAFGQELNPESYAICKAGAAQLRRVNPCLSKL
jgi:hypothetical protein